MYLPVSTAQRAYNPKAFCEARPNPTSRTADQPTDPPNFDPSPSPTHPILPNPTPLYTSSGRISHPTASVPQAGKLAFIFCGLSHLSTTIQPWFQSEAKKRPGKTEGAAGKPKSLTCEPAPLKTKEAMNKRVPEKLGRWPTCVAMLLFGAQVTCAKKNKKRSGREIGELPGSVGSIQSWSKNVSGLRPCG